MSVPGASDTWAINLNNRTQVVGKYTTDNETYGFLYDHGAYTNIDVPGASSTTPLAINDLGEIVGVFSDSSGDHGFIATPHYGLNELSVSDFSHALDNLRTIVTKAADEHSWSMITAGIQTIDGDGLIQLLSHS